MKKFLIFLLLTSSTAFADNFQYASPAECTAAMTDYYARAMEEASHYPVSSEQNYGFTNMAAFFYHFGHNQSSKQNACHTKTCQLTLSANCSLATNTSMPPWSTLIESFLHKQTSYLDQAHYDKTLLPESKFSIVCVYSPTEKLNWDKCGLTLKSL